jgi:twitching motility two-component system response regulator PilH
MRTVLVVDDSLSVRKVVERALRGQGLGVLLAASAAEAKQRIEREAPDLVVCDVILPDVDGFEVCRYVKSHPRAHTTPVLLMSGVVDARTRDQAAQARADDLLPKPFAGDELVRKARELLQLHGDAGRASSPPQPAARLITGPASRAAAGVPAPPPAGPPAAPGDLRACLQVFVEVPGVQQALLVDRDGFLLESATQPAVEGDVVGAMTSCLGQLFDGMAQDLGQGTLRRVILENERGTVLFQFVKRSAMLVVVLVDAMALGRVRYEMRRALPELIRAL